jgi:hypothetical protein
MPCPKLTQDTTYANEYMQNISYPEFHQSINQYQSNVVATIRGLRNQKPFSDQ